MTQIENSRRWREKNRKKVTDNTRRYKWKDQGINPNAAQAIYDKATNCKICNKPISGKNKQVDHDHKTGQIRGVLCRACNTTLGMVNEDIVILQAMITYLNTYILES